VRNCDCTEIKTFSAITCNTNYTFRNFVWNFATFDLCVYCVRNSCNMLTFHIRWWLSRWGYKSRIRTFNLM